MDRAKERLAYEFGGFRLDAFRRQLSSIDGRPLVVRDKTFDTLLYLVEHAGRLVEKTELMAALWPNMIVEENNLNQVISTLRRVLGDDAQSPRFIATVTRRGYQFIGDVQTVGRPPEGRSQPASDAGTKAPCEPAMHGADAAPDVASVTSVSTPRFRAGAAIYLGTALTLAIVVVAAYRLAADNEATTAAAPASMLSLHESELVSDFAGSHSQPTLSSGGRTMAFASGASGSMQIWVKNLAGGDPMQVTHGDLPARWPSWSPRDDSLLFERLDENGNRSIWSVGPLGTPQPRLVVERGATPSYSWDGGSFVYAVGSEIWMADADGGNRRRIEGVPAGAGLAPPAPSLSPSGRLIAFVRADLGPYGDIWLIPVGGGEARQLTFHGFGIDSAYNGAPSWTPDGRFIVYAAAVGAVANQHLMRVHVESGNITQLTSGVGDYGRPVVSRDGERMLYTSTRSVWQLMRTDLRTLAHEPIHESRNPIIHTFGSPDGRAVSFFSFLPSGAQVFTIGVDGEGLRQWTFDDTGRNFSPVWGDHRWLYYYQDDMLAKLSVDDGHRIEVLEGFSVTTRPYLVARGDKVAYLESGGVGDLGRTVIRDVASGLETEVPKPLVIPTQFSRDGSHLLGYRQEGPDRTIVVCPTSGDACETVGGVDRPVRGREPRWSVDESRIYFRRPTRPLRNSPFIDEFRVADSDGENETALAEFGPVDDHTAFAVTDDGALIWSRYQRDDDEIWMTRVRSGSFGEGRTAGEARAVGPE